MEFISFDIKKEQSLGHVLGFVKKNVSLGSFVFQAWYSNYDLTQMLTFLLPFHPSIQELQM